MKKKKYFEKISILYIVRRSLQQEYAKCTLESLQMIINPSIRVGVKNIFIRF